MTDTELISSWLEQPALLKKEQPALIQDLSAKFPYFFPLHYLKAIRAFSYHDAPINMLSELFPVNRILLYQMFTEEVPQPEVELSNQEPLFPDDELQRNIFQQDYFAGQGIVAAEEIPNPNADQDGVPLSRERELMVVMSFSEWLRYLQERNQKAKEDEAGKSALRALWQKQKLTAAIEEEEEEIPEEVFEMAVNSITSKEEIVSESMAAVYALQGKKEKALAMYKKLSLQNPEKSAYFAKKIEDLQKGMDI